MLINTEAIVLEDYPLRVIPCGLFLAGYALRLFLEGIVLEVSP